MCTVCDLTVREPSWTRSRHCGAKTALKHSGAYSLGLRTMLPFVSSIIGRYSAAAMRSHGRQRGPTRGSEGNAHGL